MDEEELADVLAGADQSWDGTGDGADGYERYWRHMARTALAALAARDDEEGSR